MEAQDEGLYALDQAWFEAARKDWKAAQAYLRVKKPKVYSERLHRYIEDVNAQFTRQIDAALDRLHVRFANQPEVYDAALEAIAAGHAPLRLDEGPPVATVGDTR
jgi:hypothetical protein